MSSLKIHRPKKFIGQLRKFSIYVDDVKIGSIANGATEEFQIKAGNHTIFFKQDVFSSTSKHSFSILENEQKFIFASYKTSSIMMIFMIISFVGSALLSQYLTDYFKLTESSWLFFYIAFCFIILMIMKAAKMFTIHATEEQPVG